jgi:hypothetical protein
MSDIMHSLTFASKYSLIYPSAGLKHLQQVSWDRTMASAMDGAKVSSRTTAKSCH